MQRVERDSNDTDERRSGRCRSTYASPVLTEYGSLTGLTLGAKPGTNQDTTPGYLTGTGGAGF